MTVCIEKTFALGDAVTWTSQANASIRTKTGTIVAVVPANIAVGAYIDQRASLSAYKYDMSSIAWGYVRPTTSYLVAVTMVSRTGKLRDRQRLYWPRVSALRQAERQEDNV